MTGVNRELKIKNVRWPEALDTRSSQRMGSKRKKVQKLAKSTRKEAQHSQGPGPSGHRGSEPVWGERGPSGKEGPKG
jgi:hypothetical protein